MTREEAIEEVEVAFDIWESEYDTGNDWSKAHKARDMAIKALEQETVSKEAYDHEYFLRKEFELKIDELQRQLEEQAVKAESILDKIRAEIINYEGDCRLSVDEYPSCKQCTDNVFESIYAIIDKCKEESEKTI
jgi:hypothetical protein